MKSFLIFFTLITAGCSVLDMAQFEKPQMKLDGIELKKFSIDQMDLLFKVNVTNPNNFDINMKSLLYEVEMNDQKIATQNITTPTKVEALKTSQVTLPLSVNLGQIFSSIGGFLKSRESSYQIKGTAQFGFISLPFSESGSFKIENGQLVHDK